MSLTLRATTSGCTLNVRVHPGARRNAITGTHDGALKISLTPDALTTALQPHLA